MLTVYQLHTKKILTSRTGKPWSRPRIAREAKKLGAKLAKCPYGQALGITDEILANLVSLSNLAKTRLGRKKKTSKNTP